MFTGIFAPLVFLWLILAYVSRGMVICETTKNLEKELAKLTYSTDDSEARVHAIAEALRHQAQEPSAVSERAVSQAQYLHDGLHCQTEQLGAAANGVLSRLEETGAAFERSLTAMGPNAKAAADRVQAATDAIHNFTDSAISDFGQITAGIEDTGSQFRRQSEEVVQQSNDAIARIDDVGETLRKHAQGLNEAAGTGA